MSVGVPILRERRSMGDLTLMASHCALTVDMSTDLLG